MSTEACKTIRIAWIACAADDFGVRQSTLAMALALQRRGCSVRIILLGQGSCDAFDALGLDTICVASADFPFKGRSSFTGRTMQFFRARNKARRALRLVDAALSGHAFDLIHFRNQNLVSLAGWLARKRGVPCIWHLANAIGGDYPLRINRLIYHLQCRALNVTPFGNSRFTAQSFGSLLVKPRILYLGVDSRRFDPEGVSSVRRSKLGIPENAILFGLFARIVSKKGQERFLQALLSISDYTSPLHLLFLGGPVEGEFPDQLRRLAADHGMADRLHMPGVVTDTERYYEMIDVGVNARIDPEPFGLTVIESMMMRRPVLAHALGGPRETIIDGVTGWHVPDPSVDSFRKGIIRALADRARWKEMGEAGRKHALPN